MKKAVLSSVLMVLCILTLAQVPESFNYQVVVRDGLSNSPLVNQNVSFRFSIIKGSIVKTTVFTEKQSAVTNNLGLVNLAIGNGTDQTGSIVTIDWGADEYSLKVEIDPTGGAGYVEMGTTQILSVPYARYARFADTAFTYFENDPVFVLHPSYGISAGNIEDWTEAHSWGNHALMGYVPGTRTLTINGTTLDLSDNRSWVVGTVTSVSLSLPSIFSVSGSPITASGILDVSLTSQTANLIFASPDGSSGNPSFRALLASDIPSLDWSKITSGKPTTITGFGITDAVTTAGDQTIAGNKTFSGTTTVITPVNATDAVTKAYVDDNFLTDETQDLADVLSKGNNAENMTIVNVSQLGVGTTTPEFNLTLSGDGGILATGTFGTGKELLTSGEGTRLIWYPSKAAFRAGKVFGDEWDVDNIGLNSVGMGASSKASGSTSTAMGNYTTASGSVSTAMGNNTTASGDYSTAIGVSTKASGSYSIAMGNGIEASGINSIAIALNDQTGTIVTQDNTMAIMGGNVGIGTISPAEPLTVNGVISATGGNSTDWNAAFSWGDHSLAGYFANGGETGGTARTLGNKDDFSFGFKTNDATRVFIANDGKVGIGTTIPAEMLEVAGKIKATGGMDAGSNIISNIADPINATDAANKTYVDASLQGQINMLKNSLVAGGIITDVENNVYNTVKIGYQVWMAENLKTTKYRNGDLIGTTTPATLDISGESTPKYQWAYAGNESNVATYGRLYTWYAVTDSRNVCPTGWHIPSNDEWTTLTNYLTNNGYGYEGSGNDIAKSMASTSGWATYETLGTVGNDQASNNSSGFTALPGGYRNNNGPFNYIASWGCWWSSSENMPTSANGRRLSYIYSGVTILVFNKGYGFSVRCIRD